MMGNNKDNEIKFLRWIFACSENDPVAHCKVYNDIGCAHVDGCLCDMKTCNILSDYKKQLADNSGEVK